MNTFCVQLNDCEFFAYHGLYEQEQKDGNTFWATIKVVIDAADFEATSSLSDTVDYQRLYEIAHARMQTPTLLLEQLAVWIANDVAIAYPKAIAIDIHICKKSPPIGGHCRNSEVIYSRGVDKIRGIQ